MYDPLTQAFDIKYPWYAKSKYAPRSYHKSFITIWHKDPEKRGNKVCRRNDDTCGWSTPNPTVEEREQIEVLARQQYGIIFEKQVAGRDHKSYAYLCNEPQAEDAIYWCWRAIKRQHFRDSKKVMWQYGVRLTFKETQEIFDLATRPLDNLQNAFRGVKDEDSFVDFFLSVYRCFRRFHRSWWQHPRWHVHHWRVQIHPWCKLKRRFWDKCAVCGKRGFPKNISAISNWNGDKIWHYTCDARLERPTRMMDKEMGAVAEDKIKEENRKRAEDDGVIYE